MQWWINFPFFRPSSLYLKCYSQWSSVNKIKILFQNTFRQYSFSFYLGFLSYCKNNHAGFFYNTHSSKIPIMEIYQMASPLSTDIPTWLFQFNVPDNVYSFETACPSFLTAKLNSRSRILLIHSVIFYHIREILCQKVFYFTCSNYHE